jgi:hypothetical protein
MPPRFLQASYASQLRLINIVLGQERSFEPVLGTSAVHSNPDGGQGARNSAERAKDLAFKASGTRASKIGCHDPGIT